MSLLAVLVLLLVRAVLQEDITEVGTPIPARPAPIPDPAEE